MTILRARAGALATATEADVARLWQLRLVAGLSESRFLRFVGLAIVRANVAATSLADLVLTALVIRHLRQPVSPLGLVPTPAQIDVERLSEAARTVLVTDVASIDTAEGLEESRARRLRRLARAEPLGTAQDSLQRAMAQRELAGWLRSTGPDPCERCRGWADGQVRAPTVAMKRHPGCTCEQVPQFT